MRHHRTVYRFAAAPRRSTPPLAAAPLSPQPPNAAYDPDWYVARPAEERLAAAHLAYPGLPVVVLAPQGFGKTWLLRHVLHLARAQGPTRVVLRSLDLFDAEACASLERFLKALAHHLAAALDLGAAIVERTWERSGNPQANLSWLLERVVLPPLEERGETLALCLDRADALGGAPSKTTSSGCCAPSRRAARSRPGIACACCWRSPPPPRSWSRTRGSRPSTSPSRSGSATSTTRSSASSLRCTRSRRARRSSRRCGRWSGGTHRCAASRSTRPAPVDAAWGRCSPSQRGRGSSPSTWSSAAPASRGTRRSSRRWGRWRRIRRSP